MNDEQLKEHIINEFNSMKQEFGRGGFYQSLPLLDISGQRPTELRIKEYRIWDIVDEKTKILDIGCNVGFLDITLAYGGVKSVTGVENNSQLIKIASKVAQHLKINNVSFVVANYNDWEKNTIETFDVVFSFAVHYWLQVTPEKYCKRLYDFLNVGGYVFFESQNLKTVDLDFEKYYQEFIGLGMSVVNEGIIKDDNIIERKFYVFKKS